VGQCSSLVDRFWPKVDKNGAVPSHRPELGNCWLWTAAKTGGYGVIGCCDSGPKKQDLAHRVSWRMHCGPIPDGLLVLHKCDNRSCVNPKHLFVGTYQDNSDDCCLKDRIANAERSRSSKLTVSQVLEIRKRYALGTRSGELCAAFGISHTTVQNIVTGRTWSRVPGGDRSITRGRWNPRGARASNAKLTESQVREIRERVKGGDGYRLLAREFGVMHTTIRQIVLNLTWL
jgi:hypothetical protein